MDKTINCTKCKESFRECDNAYVLKNGFGCDANYPCNYQNPPQNHVPTIEASGNSSIDKHRMLAAGGRMYGFYTPSLYNSEKITDEYEINVIRKKRGLRPISTWFNVSFKERQNLQ